MRVLRCLKCGMIDASTPTRASDGNECNRCNSTNTEAVILRTL